MMTPRLDVFDIDEDGDTQEATPDLDMNLRLVDGDTQGGAIVDMGAYEFQVTCSADLNGDGQVDIDDVAILIGLIGTYCVPNCPPYCPGDLNTDCVIDGNDLVIMLNAWGSCLNPGNVPPPQSIQDCIDKYGQWPDKLANCIAAIFMTGGG